ncbi:MAG: phospho-N-acetylmuramoyl-pentapeptide-transferase [Erysipelotrichaceae bacterium]|nr:phospho-N-acetylmuramoyl-pentapeptide-transferase [Erysipelotrichaceae bacterium]
MNPIVLYIAGFLITLIAMILIMPSFIRYLKNRNISQVTSEYALEEFKKKEKTPIMGGLLFVVIPVIVACLVRFPILRDSRVLFVILSYLLYCSVGFIDDSLIIRSQSNDGLSPKTRLIMEFAYTLILFVLFRNIIPQQVTIPFLNVGIQVPWFIFLPFMILLYMAEANAVNFTDGMDGLCAGVSLIALIPFIIFTFIYHDSNLSLLLICIAAGLIGYLYFNRHPARIFMGDSGSLALGALFSALALVMDKTVALFVIGGVFVIEMFCVVLQQVSVRVFHKRVFSYTPIHYAFVIKGYKETKIVYSFYLLQLILSVIGFFIGLHTL